MRICKGHEVVPICLVEARERGKDEDIFLIANWIGRCGEIVEMIVYDRRRRFLSIRRRTGFFEWG